MKKALKITGIALLVIVVFLAAAPFLFKGKLEKLVKNAVNENVNATVEWERLNISLLRSFPDARLTLRDFSIVNREPFAGDTLAAGKRLYVTMGIPQLFKGGDTPLSINEISLDGVLANIKVDGEGRANYDIAIEKDEDQKSGSDGDFSFSIKRYELTNTRINYLDEETQNYLRLSEFNHSGSGDFSAENFTLKTDTETLLSLEMGGAKYFENLHFDLSADLDIDLAESKYSFLQNEAHINQLPLEFDGYVQAKEEGTEVDISFETPSSDFRNFLAAIPEAYAADLKGVDTSGNFSVKGTAKGLVDDDHIPKLDVAVKSNNASYKYPDLPKRVDNIHIDVALRNDTGLADDTWLQINRLTFRIDQDAFSTKGNIRNLTTNMSVDMTADGTLNLANIDKAYPLDMEQELNGILKAGLSTRFDMNSLKNEQYQNIKSEGSASLSNFSYRSDDLPDRLDISNADLRFDTNSIILEDMQLQTGQSDLQAKGRIDNLMGFVFTDQDLKGRFNVSSNTFSVGDFMTGDDSESGAKGDAQPVKIPPFLDVTLDFTADQVLYDDLSLTDTRGTLILADQTATLQNVTSGLFEGQIALDGSVNTKEDSPIFDMKLSLSNVHAATAFTNLDLIQSLAPIARALDGLLNTNISLNGQLDDDMTPVLTSLSGDAFAEILNATIKSGQTPVLSNLNSRMNFVDINNKTIRDLRTNLQFKDGNIEVAPFDFEFEGINITASGKHSMDNNMEYTASLDVPAKYLGSQLGNAVANLSDQDLETMTATVPIGLTGTFSNPQVQVNTGNAVKALTSQIVEHQKGRLQDEATDKVKDVLGVGGDEKEENRVTEALEDPEEAIRQEAEERIETAKEEAKEEVKDKAKDALKGLFGGKKDD